MALAGSTGMGCSGPRRALPAGPFSTRVAAAKQVLGRDAERLAQAPDGADVRPAPFALEFSDGGLAAAHQLGELSLRETGGQPARPQTSEAVTAAAVCRPRAVLDGLNPKAVLCPRLDHEFTSLRFAFV